MGSRSDGFDRRLLSFLRQHAFGLRGATGVEHHARRDGFHLAHQQAVCAARAGRAAQESLRPFSEEERQAMSKVIGDCGLRIADFQGQSPSYLDLLRTGKLAGRVEALESLLERCTVCPRDCLNNRLQNEIAACYSGRLPIVSSYTPHFGEEPPLVGTRGAGNIFFGNCNLRCVYCQNYQISQTHKEQIKNEVTHERLAEMMLELQAQGCHNLNFVSPTHFAPQMARAILIAAEKGLRLPIVYNTNAYDSFEVLKLLDNIVDVYLPDLKYAGDDEGFLYSKVRSYASVSRAALREMHRQMGDELVYFKDGDEAGLLQRGLVIR